MLGPGPGPWTRRAANSIDGVITAADQRILQECHGLYSNRQHGLLQIGRSLGLLLLPPRKKINVMIMGNHSSGKSTFINWYVEEHIQKTGVAIETQGFTFVTSGQRREYLTGSATLHLYSHFRPLLEFQGVSNYLTTKISSSKQRKFSLVMFIDTPGLVDGDMNYPFDVNNVFVWLGEQADLIFVFFDPMGQALCKRTLNVVERLNVTSGKKMHFYLSKADEAGGTTDRQKVLMQIVQELCRRSGLNKCGFELQTVYIPTSNTSGHGMNHIGEMCKIIEKTINETVQNTLNQLEKDCSLITETITDKLTQDSETVMVNTKARIKSIICKVLGIFLPTFFALSFVLTTLSRHLLQKLLNERILDVLLTCVNFVIAMWDWMPEDLQFCTLLVCAGISALFILQSRFYSRMCPTLSRKERRRMGEWRAFMEEIVKPKKNQLFEEYLRQRAAE
uniref:uncharacterized protein isoform X1 n=2 Tax=Pristiophorus japonicus TaxID=55135 RepID=UPI00398F8600